MLASTVSQENCHSKGGEIMRLSLEAVRSCTDQEASFSTLSIKIAFWTSGKCDDEPPSTAGSCTEGVASRHQRLYMVAVEPLS